MNKIDGEWDMKAGYQYALNTAQSEIMLSESVSEGSAVNTISVQMSFPEVEAGRLKTAVDALLNTADIFAAAYRDGGFVRGAVRLSELCQKTSEAEAQQEIDRKNKMPMDPSEQLYQVQVIPLSEGGSLLYARFHHVILDGRGMCLFAQYVLDALAGKGPAASVFFAEDKGAEETDESGFWKEYLSGADMGVVFSEEPCGLNKTTYRIKSGISRERLGDWGKRMGVGVPYILLAAQAVYLAEATGAEEAVVLMPRLNRNAQTAKTLGCYVLLVPVRIPVHPGDSFAEVCRQAQESARKASAHKGCGYSAIAKACGSREALSEYGFNYYSAGTCSQIRHKVVYHVAGALRSHLVWNIFEAEELTFSLDCRDGIYSGERAAYFYDAIAAILRQGMEEDNAKVESIPVTGDRERARLDSVRGPELFVGREETIPSLLRDSAEKYGDLPAVYAGDRALTFRELDRLSDNIARGLVRRNVRPGDRVAFMLKRDWRLLPALFGISKAGAAFIPVDPAYPQDRIAYILSDSQAALLIGSKDTLEAGRGVDVEELLVPGEERLPVVKQEDIAYLIYTSGTTGRPKGVMLSHRGIANIVKPENNPFNRFFTKHCKGLTAIGSVCFDISLFEFFVPLFNGKFVELGDEKAMFDPAELSRCMSRHGADALHCTPSRLLSYLRHEGFRSAMKNVRAVLSAGEVLSAALVRELKKMDVHIFNGYGPTETTIGATITEDGDSETIGRPLANTGLLLLNGRGKQVPLGAIGEICVYGMGLGIGYRGRQEETAARFTLAQGRKIYRTGDLGRFAEDGRLLYIGRNDRQVKLRGLRIELAEIENAMLSFPGVTQAVCTVRKSSSSEHLAAFFTAAAEVDTKKLKDHISGLLTPYMVPDVFKKLDAMPQTAGGKIDYKKLDEEQLEWNKEYRAPYSETEKVICDAMAKVLGLKRAGADDNFFELGGDSLGAAELLVEIEKGFEDDFRLEYGDIYRYPTPALLAGRIADSGEAKGYPVAELDYRGIPEYLKKSGTLHQRPLGNVLLTGATGYLGNHILVELLRSSLCDKIYCLARSKRKTTAVKRITGALFYYAEDDFTEGGKWCAVEGDITLPELFVSPFTEKIDTIINCAANVAHFAYGDALTKVNEGGVRNLIDYARKVKARIVQISTVSVGGMLPADQAAEKRFTEEDFFVGQEIFNEYIYSKYMAEYLLLRAAVEDGLDVKLMRVGNLQGRIADGEFQMNMRSNNFMRRLSAYIDIGFAPRSVFDGYVEFSPVDEVAGMVVALAATDGHGAFHVCPPTETAFRRLFAVLDAMGKPVKPVEDADFERLFMQYKADGQKQEAIETLSMERGNGAYEYLPFTRDLTVRSLKEMNRNWREVDDEYLVKCVRALTELDMF